MPVAIGERLATDTGMLRITLPNYSGHGVFVLEGKLAGLWTKELLRVAREENQSYGNIFDLREVTYVDSAGEEVLRILSRFGAKFITESAYGKDLCRRLKLHRVTALDACRQRPGGSIGSGNGRQSHAKKPEPLSNAAEQDPQKCEE